MERGRAERVEDAAMATEAAATPVAEMDARDDGGSNEPNGDAVDAMAVDVAKEEVETEAAEDEREKEEEEKEKEKEKEADGEEKEDVNEREGDDEEGSDGDAAQQAAVRRQVNEW